MRIEFTKEQISLREELRKYFKNLMNNKLKKELKKGAREGGGPEFRKALEKIGLTLAVTSLGPPRIIRF